MPVRVIFFQPEVQILQISGIYPNNPVVILRSRWSSDGADRGRSIIGIRNSSRLSPGMNSLGERREQFWMSIYAENKEMLDDS